MNFSVHRTPADEAANLRIIATGGEAAAMFRHPNGTRRITTLALVAPDESGLPPSTPFVNDSGALRLGVGREWSMRLTLDGGAQRQQRDLRPTLPLIVRY